MSLKQWPNNGVNLMRVIYWANHSQRLPSNDDEGSIAHALRMLGHEVICVNENVNPSRYRGDFLLFHHCPKFSYMDSVSIPRVFWSFDRFNIGDPVLAHRTQARMDWGSKVLKRCVAGFCTDGDYVRLHNELKDTDCLLYDLKQGADERIVGHQLPTKPHTSSKKDIDILFVGTRGHGTLREEFVDMMARQYKDRFVHVPKNVYRQDLKYLVGRSRIVVAPDFPVSDHYWSNRVYLMLGFGAFLLHPYCEDLSAQYVHGNEIIYYHDRDDLHDKIEHYLTDHQSRQVISDNGLLRTKKFHTYYHRCEVLMNHMKDLL